MIPVPHPTITGPALASKTGKGSCHHLIRFRNPNLPEIRRIPIIFNIFSKYCAIGRNWDAEMQK
ncbi:MAG: hypothetical protein PVG15_04085 [Desulfobacterales bacterium]